MSSGYHPMSDRISDRWMKMTVSFRHPGDGFDHPDDEKKQPFKK